MPILDQRARRFERPEVHSEPRIVLAIDYGTTFTGLAWMQIDGKTPVTLSQLKVFRTWPGKNDPKVRSEISFSYVSTDDEDAEYRQWGYSIDEKSKVLRWTKLELCDDKSLVEGLQNLQELLRGLPEVKAMHNDTLEFNDLPRHLSKSGEDVIEAFLGHVAREWKDSITDEMRHVLERAPVDVVVTHPANWPYEARNTLLRAVLAAFHKEMFPTRRNIHTFTEPEACALYVIQDMIRNRERLNIGDCFILCDAGGGTVDLVSYRLESLSPLEMSIVGKVSGAPVGATNIDRAFLAWLDTKVKGLDIHPAEFGKGGHYVLMPKAHVILRKFEDIKRSFTGTETDEISIPRGLEINSSDEVERESRQLQLTSEIMKDLFHVSIRGVQELIMRQAAAIQEERRSNKSCHISHIFLAGGFAESKYLYQEVRATARRLGNIKVKSPSDCWSAVVQGAVLRGAGVGVEAPPTIASCPFRYGICLRRDLSPTSSQSRWTVDYRDERAFSPSELIWLVERGDIIFPGDSPAKKLRLSFSSREVCQTTTVTLITDRHDFIPHSWEQLGGNDAATPTGFTYEVPVRLDQLKPNSYVKRQIDPTRPKKDKRNYYYELAVELSMEVRSAVTVVIRHDKQELGRYTTTSLTKI